jgi:hypothetical protein
MPDVVKFIFWKKERKKEKKDVFFHTYKEPGNKL